MKKSFNFILLASFFLVAIALNVILFFTLPPLRIHAHGFWFVWGCTFLIPAIVWIFSITYLNQKSSDQIINLPVLLTVLVGGFAAYVMLGFRFFFYAPVINLTLVIIAETCLTVVYLIILLFVFFFLGYIKNNQSTVKEKVLFIRMLQADINACIPLINDPTLIKQLNDLSEKVRFSDPMSHESLKNYENGIMALVADLNMKARTGETDDIAQDIQKINSLLDFRNERCKFLK